MYGVKDQLFRLLCELDIYVGENGRLLKWRVQEHRNALLTANFDSSALSEHAWIEHHEVDLEKAEVLQMESKMNERLLQTIIIIKVPLNP